MQSSRLFASLGRQDKRCRSFSIGRVVSTPSPSSTSAKAAIVTSLLAAAATGECYRRESTATSTLPRHYDRTRIHAYWNERPLSVMKRMVQVAYELTPCLAMYIIDFKLLPSDRQGGRGTRGTGDHVTTTTTTTAEEEMLYKSHAIRLRNALTKLGPAFVKAGQQLSIRPDLVPAAVLKELQQLCDAVQPVPNHVALSLLREELNIDCTDLSEYFSQDLELVASASLGQVYKSKLKKQKQQQLHGNSTNDDAYDDYDDVEVAIKIQRPNIRQDFSLDLYLLQWLGSALDGLFTSVTKQTAYHHALFDSFSKGSYSELDYELEAANQRDFAKELAKRGCHVKIPKVYWATEKVLCTEWIHGIRLSDAPKEQIRELIPDGVELFLIQLLDYGRFHADPHPGNLYVTNMPEQNNNTYGSFLWGSKHKTSKTETTTTTTPAGGRPTLCLLDFGLCSDIEPSARAGMTRAIVHLLTGDWDALVERDAKDLGFLPHDLNTDELKPILKTILTRGLLDSKSSMQQRKRNLMDISNELNEVFFQYPFSVPPFFALVTRGLGLLEGIALTGDADFDIFQAALPYARRRAISYYSMTPSTTSSSSTSSSVTLNPATNTTMTEKTNAPTPAEAATTKTTSLMKRLTNSAAAATTTASA